MENVRREMKTIKEAIKGKALTTVDELIERTDHPFTLVVMARLLPDKFKPPQIEMFDGGRDPLDHLEAYKTHMNLQHPPMRSSAESFLQLSKGLP